VSVIVNKTIVNFLKENVFFCVEMKDLQLESPLRPLCEPQTLKPRAYTCSVRNSTVQTFQEQKEGISES